MKAAWGLAGVIGVLLASPLFGQQNRISSAIDNQRIVVLDSKVRPLALAEHGDEGAVEPSLKLPWITLWFKRTPAQEDALARLLAAQRDSSSEQYHKWLGSDEYADQFGLSPDDFEKVAAWLERQGFHVEYKANDRDFIAFSGTAGQVRNAFHTELHRYTIRGQSHYVNATAPGVPEALSDIVLSLQGITDVHPQPRVIRGDATRALHPNEDNGGGAEILAPDDIAAIYNIDPLYQQGIDGAGQSIAILGGSSIDLDDIRSFRTHYNLTGSDPRIVQCCGMDPGETMDVAEMEADLDVEWSSAVARGARIILVYAQNPLDTIQYAVDQNIAPVISESFGLCEAGAVAMGLSFDTYRSLAQAANAKGMTWVDASGDAGAADCDSGYDSEASLGPAVDFPASIPEVTGVGGTEFDEGIGTWWSVSSGPNLGSALGYISEKAWNDTAAAGQLSASGGGPSAHFSKPSWQAGLGVPADGMRDVPDVSLTASPFHDPYNIFTIDPSTGQHVQMAVGGTSVPAPVFAGIVALLNQSLARAGKGTAGNINPELYSLARTPGIFHAVTAGDNIVPCAAGTPNCTSGSYGYSAGRGYDSVTGLGSIDAHAMVTCWGSPSERTKLSFSGQDQRSCHPTIRAATIVTATPELILTSGWTKIQAAVSQAPGRNARIPAGTVTFTAGGTMLGTVALAAGVASIAVAGKQLPVGTDTITADYSGSTTFDPSAGSVTVTVNAPASGVTFSADPNPIVSATGTGMTTLSWNAPGYSQLVITVGSVTGTPLTGTVGSSGTAQTDSSVTDGLQFFLLDLTSRSPIASLTVHVVAPTVPPVLTSITPSNAEAGSDGFKMQAVGSNFTASSVVKWNGMKLATQFLNGSSLLATVPASRLTAERTIQVQVDTNGQVSAPVPFVVGNTPWLSNSTMTKSASSTGCRAPTPVASFSFSDPNAIVWFSVEGALAGDIAELDWYTPDGSKLAGWSSFWGPLPASGGWCFSKSIPIADTAVANMGGEWKVVVTWNGTRFFTLPFTIVAFPEGYYDGKWSGTTSQGLPMSMTVVSGGITSYSVTLSGYVATGPRDPWPITIYGNSFSESASGLSGTFKSATQASGKYGDTTWTATKH